MKNTIFAVSLIVLLTTGLDSGGASCQYRPPSSYITPIQIGLARDMDGPLSFFECNGAGPVYRWFVEKVNDEGGIHLSEYDTRTAECRVPLELVVRDFDLFTWDIDDVTLELIYTDEVDFIWGGPGADWILSQAQTCNYAEKVLITLEGGTSSDEDIDDWPYVWVSSSFADWYQIPVLHDILEVELDHDPVAYITYIEEEYGGAHGYEYRFETYNKFGAGNVIDAGYHSYQLTPGEADNIIATAAAALNSTPYDIFCAFTYPWNVYALTQACIDNEFNPPAILFGPGANFGRFGTAPPDGFNATNTEGIMCFAVANDKTTVSVGDTTMSMAEMYDSIAVQIEDDWIDSGLPCASGNLISGEQVLDYWGTPCYVAALEMWKYAVEAVGDIDPEGVRDALAALSPENPAQTVFGDTWFTVFGDGLGGGKLAYECHTGEIGQWQSGMVEIIGYDGINANLPNYCVTANLTYPMTDLWGWLS